MWYICTLHCFYIFGKMLKINFLRFFNKFPGFDFSSKIYPFDDQASYYEGPVHGFYTLSVFRLVLEPTNSVSQVCLKLECFLLYFGISMSLF